VATVKADSSFFGNSPKKDISFYWKEVNGICRDSASVIISFFTRVRELGPNRDTALYSFDGILHMNAEALDAARGETGLWTTLSGSNQIAGETEPDAQVGNLVNGLNSYRWTVSNKNQGGAAICTDSYIYNVNVYNVFIPNVFSPNGDGLYDEFYVRGLDLDNQRAELRIINSAGTEVFHTANTNGGTWKNWDGNDPGGSALPEGTYYYLLKMISWGFDGEYDTSDDQVFQKSGFIVLRRYSSGNK
jgi:gliding motility-associated-like protein